MLFLPYVQRKIADLKIGNFIRHFFIEVQFSKDGH